MHHPTHRMTHTTAFVTPVGDSGGGGGGGGGWMWVITVNRSRALISLILFYSYLAHFRSLVPYRGTTLAVRLFFLRERNVLFNDALNTFYLRLFGVRHMVKDHSDSERGNLLPPHGLLFPISSKGSFICTIPPTG